MTLTEQWQKGELPDGLYYVENNDNIVGILDWSKFAGGYNIKEVLAEVPTFEEYQANEKYIDYLKQCISVYESKDKQHAIDYLLFEETLEANKQIEHENTLLKVAIMELRDTLNTIEGKLIRAFYDDKMSFWDALVDIRKTIKKDSTND